MAVGLVMLGAVAAAAQEKTSAEQSRGASGRMYIFGGGGYNGQADDESSLGTGAAVEGGVGYRLTEKWSLEGSATYLRHSRNLVYYALSTDALGRTASTPYYPTLDGAATYVLAQLRRTFTMSRVRPFIGFGAGIMHYSGDSWASVMAPAVGILDGPERTVMTSAAGSFTSGVEIGVGRRASLAPYISFLAANPGEAGTSMAFFTGVRVAARY